jgi:hypothetical protein
MWFDPHAMRAEIVGHRPATTATQAPAARPMSQVSRLSQALYPHKPTFRVAEVASVATLPPETDPGAMDSRKTETRFPHANSALSGPVTWTGRVVSLDEWRGLSQWEKHGPDGRHWNGITKQWEQPEGSKP